MLPLPYYLNTYDNRRKMRMISRISAAITTIFFVLLFVQVNGTKPTFKSKPKVSSSSYWMAVPVVVGLVFLTGLRIIIWWSDVQTVGRVHEYQELRILEQGRVDEAEIFEIGEAEEDVVKEGEEREEVPRGEGR